MMGIIIPEKCLRSLDDCEPYAQVESDCGSSFICCGRSEPVTRNVEQDEFRHCWKNSMIDERTDFDKRDVISTIAILSQALHVDANIKATKEK